MATKDDIARLEQNIDRVDRKTEVLRPDVASDLAEVEKRMGDQITHLRRAVMEYHWLTIGHCLVPSEFEERLCRVDQRLGIAGSRPG